MRLATPRKVGNKLWQQTVPNGEASTPDLARSPFCGCHYLVRRGVVRKVGGLHVDLLLSMTVIAGATQDAITWLMTLIAEDVIGDVLRWTVMLTGECPRTRNRLDIWSSSHGGKAMNPSFCFYC